MKKILIMILVMVFAVTLAFPCVAQEMSITAQYDPAEMIVRLSGFAKGNTNVILAEVGSGATDFSENNLPVDFFTLKTYGNFIFTFTMPQNAPAGKYDIYLSGDNATAKTSFIYYDGAEADNLVVQLNQIKDLGEFKEFIKSNAAKLGVDETDSLYIQNIDKGAELLFECGDEFTDCKTFISKLYKYFAISDMHGKNTEEIVKIIKNYEDNLEIDYLKDFENNSDYSEEVRIGALELLSLTDYYQSYSFVRGDDISASFKDVLKMHTVLARVKMSQSYEELQSVYETHLSDIVDADERYTKDNAKAVFKLLIKKDFTQLSHLEDNFASALTNVIDSSEKETDNKNSSSSKPGSSGGGVSYPSNSPVNTSQDPIVSNDASNKNADEKGFTVTKLQIGDVNFGDLPNNHWSYKAVSSLAVSGIISGYEDGNFLPDNKITRAEFAKLMVSAFKFTGSKAERFSDVEDGAWYAEFVNVAADNSLINGYEGNFRPGEKIKRQDAILIAYRCSQRVGVNYSGTYNFDDMYDADTYAWPAIFSLAANKIVLGDDTNCVNPQSEITRAEAAQLIYGLVNDICIKLNK